MTRVLKAIGLMSGTSMDGIDAAILDTDGEVIEAFGPARFQPYPEETRARLRAASEGAASIRAVAPLPVDLERLERDLTYAHAATVQTLLHEAELKAELKAEAIDVIGFHGHTLVHNPAERATLQIGSGPKLALLTWIDVVNDFRKADVRAGGQGAPLVPIYHKALVGDRVPTAVVNIGGVANVTFVGSNWTLLAFDTGAGNGPIDDWALRHAGRGI